MALQYSYHVGVILPNRGCLCPMRPKPGRNHTEVPTHANLVLSLSAKRLRPINSYCLLHANLKRERACAGVIGQKHLEHWIGSQFWGSCGWSGHYYTQFVSLLMIYIPHYQSYALLALILTYGIQLSNLNNTL